MQLKGLNPGGKLPVGLLSGGKADLQLSNGDWDSLDSALAREN